MLLVAHFTTPRGFVSSIWRDEKALFIPKPDSEKLRLIKVDNIWVRLAGRGLARLLKDEAVQLLRSTQVGVGVKGGIEVAGHTLERWIDDVLAENDSEHIVAALDIEGAFPRLERGPARRAIEQYLPNALPFFDHFYGSPETMYFHWRADGVTCNRGVHAGDPMATMLFSTGAYQRCHEWFQCG